MDADLAFPHQLLDQEMPQRHVLNSRTVGLISGDEQSQSFVRYNGTLSKRVSNTISFIMLEQNTASIIVSAVATSSASIMDGDVSSCSPTLKLTRALDRKTKYENIDLPLSGLLPQFASENVVRLKPPCLYVMAKAVVPAR